MDFVPTPTKGGLAVAKKLSSNTTAGISAMLLTLGVSVPAPGNITLLVGTLGAAAVTLGGMIVDDGPHPARLRSDTQNLLKTTQKAIQDEQIKRQPELLEVCKSLEKLLLEYAIFLQEERSPHDRQDIKETLEKMKENLRLVGIQA